MDHLPIRGGSMGMERASRALQNPAPRGDRTPAFFPRSKLTMRVAGVPPDILNATKLVP